MEVAEQGTLFLDEVGDIPIEIQPKLSRALQQRNLNAGQFSTRRFNSAIAGYREAPVTSLQLTYTGVLLAVFGNQLCLPIPSIVFLMAAGAMSADGGMRTSIIVFLSVLGCLAADGIWFWFGRRWGSQAIRLLCRLTADPRSCSNNARKKFRRHGLPVLCVSKFVPGLDALMPPLCGAEGVSLTGFFAFDTVGSLLWSGCYVGLGYLFSNELDAAIRWTATFWGRRRYRTWGSTRSLCRLAWTGSSANDSATAGTPDHTADARTQTEIQYEGCSP